MTAPLAEVLRRALADIARAELPCALVGGIAVGVRAVERATRNLVFAVAVAGDREAELAVHALSGAGYLIDIVLENTATGRLATVRLFSPLDQATRVDLLFASSGIEPEVVAAAEVIELAGLSCRVAATGHLIALEVLSRSSQRPQDDLDLAALLQRATPSDLELAGAAVRQISARGCARDKDLAHDLDALITRWPSAVAVNGR